MNMQETLKICVEAERSDIWLRSPNSQWALEEWDQYKINPEIESYPTLQRVTESIVKKYSLQLNEVSFLALRGFMYKAANEHRTWKLKRAGWVIADTNFLEAHLSKLIEIHTESILGESVLKMRVSKWGDKFIYLKPRARKTGRWAAVGEDYVRELSK